VRREKKRKLNAPCGIPNKECSEACHGWDHCRLKDGIPISKRIVDETREEIARQSVADFRDRQIQKELRKERRVVIPLFRVSFDSIKNFFKRR
jgi:hypothetical protein